MSVAVLLTALLVIQSQQGPVATNPQVERTENPVNVADNSPDFRALVTEAWADRYSIEVYSANQVMPDYLLWGRANESMTPTNPGEYCPEIPFGGRNQLAWNTPYWWRIRFRGKKMGPWTSLVTFRMTQPTAVASANGNGSPNGPSYRFVGVPIAPGTTVPASELIDDVGLAYFYRLDEPSRTWIPMTEGDTLKGGIGYLAWTAPSTTLDLTQGTVATGMQSLSFPYTTYSVPVGQEITDGVPANTYRGNNLACNPFNAPISWDDRTLGGQVARQNISEAYWKWNGTEYVTYNGLTRLGQAGPIIAPFQAFGIITLNSTNTLTFYEPPDTAYGSGKPGSAIRRSPSSAPPAFTRNFWGLILEVRSGTAIDSDTIAGVDFEASGEWDPRDTEDPGADTANPWILASFEHPDWPLHPRSYTHDFRKTPVNAGDMVTWVITLSGNTNSLATVSWPNLSSISSEDWSFTLEDPGTGTTTDLALQSSVEVGPIEGKYPLILKARRLKDLIGGLEGSLATGGEPTPPSVTGGTSGVTMLELLLRAVEESVIVDSFTVRHQGGGDPSLVTASLYEGTRLLGGPVSLADGKATWSNLGERINLGSPVLWKIVYNFAAPASGTYAAEVRLAEIAGTGVYSQKPLSPSETVLLGSEVTAYPAGDDGGSHRCGLLGIETLLVFLWVGLRRALSSRECR